MLGTLLSVVFRYPTYCRSRAISCLPRRHEQTSRLVVCMALFVFVGQQCRHLQRVTRHCGYGCRHKHAQAYCYYMKNESPVSRIFQISPQNWYHCIYNQVLHQMGSNSPSSTILIKVSLFVHIIYSSANSHCFEE